MKPVRRCTLGSLSTCVCIFSSCRPGLVEPGHRTTSWPGCCLHKAKYWLNNKSELLTVLIFSGVSRTRSTSPVRTLYVFKNLSLQLAENVAKYSNTHKRFCMIYTCPQRERLLSTPEWSKTALAFTEVSVTGWISRFQNDALVITRPHWKRYVSKSSLLKPFAKSSVFNSDFDY